MKVFEQASYFQRFGNFLLEYDERLERGHFVMNRFPNGELHIQLRDQIQKKDCLIIGTIAPPETNLFEVMLIGDALKRNGAHFIKLFLPYLAYARQDKPEPGSGGGLSHIGALLGAAEIDEVITIDVHSRLDPRAIGLPLRSISAAPLVAEQVRSLKLDKYTLVAPDEGAIDRAELVAGLLGYKKPVTYLKKKRVDGLIHREIVGATEKKAVIIDDLLDTGSTLLSACKILQSQGVEQIVIFITHGLFTGSAWKQLFDLGVTALYVSNSCPSMMHRRHEKVHLMRLEALIPQLLTNTPLTKELVYETPPTHTY